MAKKRKRYGRVPGTRSDGGTPAFDFFVPSPERDFAIEQGMSESDFGALMTISQMDNPKNPPCPGPIVIHADGSIEGGLRVEASAAVDRRTGYRSSAAHPRWQRVPPRQPFIVRQFSLNHAVFPLRGLLSGTVSG